ncbi:unnamed protein product, partial [Tenebrio molitor]
ITREGDFVSRAAASGVILPSRILYFFYDSEKSYNFPLTVLQFRSFECIFEGSSFQRSSKIFHCSSSCIPLPRTKRCKASAEN